jgi:DNA-binding MarR family transcriptional regulator
MRDEQHQLDGEQTLADALWAVARRMRRGTAEGLAQWRLTPSQARAMHVLARHGTMRLSELSAHLRIAPRSGTEVVDGLEADGLVRRRPDEQDRRATLVALTTRGAELSEAIRAARHAEAERLFDRLSEREREQLARILHKLRD